MEGNREMNEKFLSGAPLSYAELNSSGKSPRRNLATSLKRMSVEHDGRDYLSSCPSLLNILSFVDYEDIGAVKSVARQFKQFIQRHSIHLARPKTDVRFLFCTQNQEDSSALHIEVYVPDETRFCITEKRIRQIYTETQITDSLQFDKPCPLMADDYQNDVNTPMRDLTVDSLEKGFWKILRLLFRLYHFRNMFLIKSASVSQSEFDGLLQLLAGTFKQLLCRVEWLSVMEAWRGVEKLYKKLGVQRVRVSQPISLPDWLPLQPLDRVEIQAKVDTDIVDFEPILNLLKKWFAGDVHIRNLRINRAILPYHSVLSALQCFPFTVEDSEPDDHFHVVIHSRPMDNQCLYFGYQMDIIELREYEPGFCRWRCY